LEFSKGIAFNLFNMFLTIEKLWILQLFRWIKIF
jgi:hypothetical protein